MLSSRVDAESRENHGRFSCVAFRRSATSARKMHRYICLAIAAEGARRTISLSLSRAHVSLPLSFLLFFSFLPALSQPDPDLRLRFRANARISPESRRGRRSGFADLRGHGATVGIRGRGSMRGAATRRKKADEREIEVDGGGGRRTEGDEENVQEDAVVAED